MRLYNVAGRAVLETDGVTFDVEQASGGAFGSDPQDLYDRWDELRLWAAEHLGGVQALTMSDNAAIGSPVPRPRQIFAIGINYASHVEESGLDTPTIPMVFAKFPSSIAGPYDCIALPQGAVDFEAELVVVIGARADQVPAHEAWRHVAGITVGQDLSERYTQWAGSAPQQMSLGKSFPGFSPIGPVVVTPDEFDDPDDIELGCAVNGVPMQKGRTSDMIFSVPAIIKFLSGIVPLLPGDLIFTGTPSGVGFTRTPQVLLKAGDELTTYAESIGEMRHMFTDRAGAPPLAGNP
ncbi:fumarylacetoacetate hydrolase family protein [Mycolicibacterium wolinskyi]|uniref:Fumarylacetoacetate hydrolase n=2 Tax=Mycolicibacterium TaxID=1866885 RepID=A0A1X2F382_9MYCO|nr:fumarylacetoacetate hydrolase family protein [Mycolicibacterium wolinskyi]MCV7287729.1 fumarylacetoacetate hydrolase family protein [Mycolicibacterium wolinskyi]MCV7294627.1 fumarylacetoacetate hydrolase family protein [Mycolicibacterium goodii]ORX12499.1 fumarylacetoacetate hydrolase [Mycolicibacterium wolinskyi]